MKLWINDNGRVACSRHGGYELAAAVAAAPSSPLVFTPLGSWAAAPDDLGLPCERCSA